MYTLQMQAMLEFERIKTAALTTEEKKIHTEAVRQHAHFDHLSASGKMDDASKERMRHNVERLKHFSQKKHDDNYSIPSWAKDLKGKPPKSQPSSSFSGHGPDFHGLNKINRGAAIGAGAILTGVAAHNLYRRNKAKQHKPLVKKTKDGGMKKAAEAGEEPGEKRALLERLVRLAATDIPNTPRLLMKQRSPEELAGLQHGVDAAFHGVQQPLREQVGKFMGGSPGVAKKVLGAGANLLIDHPETIPMQAFPIPGLTPGWLAAKKGLEGVIDRVAPIHKLGAWRLEGDAIVKVDTKTGKNIPGSAIDLESGKLIGQLAKLAGGAPTRGGFLMASDVPPMKVPSLRAPVEKTSDALPDYVTYNPGDFKKAKLSEGAGDGMSMDSQTAAENQQPEDFKKKQADVSPSVSWNPGTGGAARQASFIPPMKMQSLAAPIAKVAGLGSIVPPPPPPASPFKAAQTAKTIGAPRVNPPGPSIAEISKPKGKGFGTGIAGAFKPQSGIGGSAPVKLDTKLGPN